MIEIIVATKNAGKVKELRKLLENLPFQLRALNDFPKAIEPEETGATFQENAVLKAKSYAQQLGCWTLSDDSGLEVEALNNAPGVFSARYAGANATDREKIEKLLKEMDGIQNRNARFVCAMAICDEKGEIKFTAEGMCGGKIALAASGRNGFGYDPIFVPDGFSATFGELSGDIKQQISHRGAAIVKIIQYLRGI